MTTYKQRPCETCGKTFQPITSRMKWCSDSCRFWPKIDKSGGPNACWPWTQSLRNGYGQFNLGGRGIEYAHRLALRLSGTPIPAGMDVCHSCDNKKCCNPAHLFVGTHAENMADAASKGIMERGEDRRCAKLTAAQVRAIRADSRPQRVIAKDYGVIQQSISDIKRRKNWAHVP